MKWVLQLWAPRLRPATFLLVSSYVFGVLMIGGRHWDGFVYLTAPHILLSTVLLLRADRSNSPAKLWAWGVGCGLLGYWAEYVGVQEEWLFGTYRYGDVLGPQLWAIPVIMAVNWILVVYAVCGTIELGRPRWPWWLKTLLSAVGLVALDVLIEPVAIRLDFWTWATGHPPLQNYLGWLAVGWLQSVLFFGLVQGARNRLAPLVLGLQLAFFAALNLLI